jgi:hypothetical protein
LAGKRLANNKQAEKKANVPPEHRVGTTAN